MTAGSGFTMGQLPGRQQALPPQYLPTRNVPIRRFQMEAMQVPQLDLQQLGLGALAVPAQMGMEYFRNVLAARTGMTMAPMGAFTSYTRSMQQQQDIEQLRRLSAQGDTERIKRFVGAFTNAAYRGEDPEKVEALTGAVTQDYVRLLESGFVPQQLEDFLAPGGLSSAFATRMYRAGMGVRGPGGTRGLGVEQVWDITRQLERRFRGEGGEEMAFTRGFNMREFGEMALGMARRGTLDLSRDRGQLMRQFQDMAGAMDALKDLLGRPDAPIPELMQTLDDMFGGGGLRAIPTGRLEQMVRQAQSYGRALNLTNQGVQQVLQGATLQAQGLGLEGELGAVTALRAMPVAAATQRRAEAGPRFPEGRVRLGALSPRERMQRTQELALRTTGSEFSNKLAAMMRLRRMAPEGRFGGTVELDRLEETLSNVEAGRRLDPDDMTWLYDISRTGQFRQILGEGNAQFSGTTISGVLSDRLGLQEEQVEYNLVPYQLQANRTQMIRMLGRRAEGNAVLREAIGLTPEMTTEERRVAGQGFIEQLLEADRTPAGMREALLQAPDMRENVERMAEERGIPVETMARRIISNARTTIRGVQGLEQVFGGRTLEELQIRYGRGAMEAAREERERGIIEAELNRSMARAGFGQARGGVGGLVQNFLRGVAAAPEAGIEELVARTFGGVPSEQLRAVVGEGGEAREYLDEMRDLGQELRTLNESLQEEGLTAEKREELIESRMKAESRLNVLRGAMEGLGRFLRPGAARMAAGYGAEALRIEAATEDMDKARLADIFEEYATPLSEEEIAEATAGMTEEQMQEWQARRGRVAGIARKGLDVAMEIPERLQGEGEEIRKRREEWVTQRLGEAGRELSSAVRGLRNLAKSWQTVSKEEVTEDIDEAVRKAEEQTTGEQVTKEPEPTEMPKGGGSENRIPQPGPLHETEASIESSTGTSRARVIIQQDNIPSGAGPRVF